MPTTITGVTARDIRFPTSREHIGSDAMHPDPDYSCVYVVLRTSQPGLEGHGLTFTIGRGNEVCLAAVNALAPLVLRRTLEEIRDGMAAFWRSLTSESQLRWIGPEKGALHLATAALVNAVWDLYAKAEGKPVWKLLADMEPEQIVSLIDFRYLTDALTPDEAREILKANAPTRARREAELRRDGYPAYTTSAGWLGFSDRQLRQLCRDALAEGWSHFKIKVGADLADDLRRCTIIREEIGFDRRLMTDANQRWDVPEAIRWMRNWPVFSPTGSKNRPAPTTCWGTPPSPGRSLPSVWPPASSARTASSSSN